MLTIPVVLLRRKRPAAHTVSLSTWAKEMHAEDQWVPWNVRRAVSVPTHRALAAARARRRAQREARFRRVVWIAVLAMTSGAVVFLAVCLGR